MHGVHPVGTISIALDSRYLLNVGYVADKSIVMRAFSFHDVRLSRIHMKSDESFRASLRVDIHWYDKLEEHYNVLKFRKCFVKKTFLWEKRHYKVSRCFMSRFLILNRNI